MSRLQRRRRHLSRLVFYSFLLQIASLSVNGGWGSWGSWGACDQETGRKERTRECNDPEPKNGGFPCSDIDSVDSNTCPGNSLSGPQLNLNLT